MEVEVEQAVVTDDRSEQPQSSDQSERGYVTDLSVLLVLGSFAASVYFLLLAIIDMNVASFQIALTAAGVGGVFAHSIRPRSIAFLLTVLALSGAAASVVLAFIRLSAAAPPDDSEGVWIDGSIAAAVIVLMAYRLVVAGRRDV